jgi:hypothetical protein
MRTAERDTSRGPRVHQSQVVVGDEQTQLWVAFDVAAVAALLSTPAG